MRLSTHYYVLSLSRKTNQLHECFRDTLIDVRNKGFPVEATPGGPNGRDDRLREALHAVDFSFGSHYEQDPLKLVVVGERDLRVMFKSITAHRQAIIAEVDGDHTSTTANDLGQIVWPIVKKELSGVDHASLHAIGIAEREQRLVTGLEAVGSCADVAVDSMLLVEEDYHVRGTMQKMDKTLIVSPDVDVREVIDDVVDAIIEGVLGIGGRVIFMNKGSLTKQKRIALILTNAVEAL